MFKIFAVIVLCFSMASAYAGWLKKAMVAGSIAYAGHAVAKKVKESNEKKPKESAQLGKYNNTQTVDREIPR